MIEELEKIANALEMTGGAAASRQVTLAIQTIKNLTEEAKRERDEATKAVEELGEVQAKLAEANKLVAHYKSKDLEPTVNRLKEEVARHREMVEQKLDELDVLKKDISASDARYAKLLVEHEEHKEIRRKVELMNKWRSMAAEIMSKGLQGEMNKEDALKIAGFVTAGQKVPYQGIDPQSYKMWQQISGEVV